MHTGTYQAFREIKTNAIYFQSFRCRFLETGGGQQWGFLLINLDYAKFIALEADAAASVREEYVPTGRCCSLTTGP